MNTIPASTLPQRSRTHPLVAGGAVAVVLASATGISAMTGILPMSKATTAPSTQAVPVVAQAASAPLVLPQPDAQQFFTREDAPVQPRLYRHRTTPVEQAPGYSGNDTYQSAVQPAPRPIAVDPNAGQIVAVNTVQETEPTTVLGAVYGDLRRNPRKFRRSTL